MLPRSLWKQTPSQVLTKALESHSAGHQPTAEWKCLLAVGFPPRPVPPRDYPQELKWQKGRKATGKPTNQKPYNPHHKAATSGFNAKWL